MWLKRLSPITILVSVLLFSLTALPQPTKALLDPLTFGTIATALGYIFKAGDVALKFYNKMQEDDQPSLLAIHRDIQEISKSVSKCYLIALFPTIPSILITLADQPNDRFHKQIRCGQSNAANGH